MRRYATGFIFLLLVALFISIPAARSETSLRIASPPLPLFTVLIILNNFDRIIGSMRRDGTLNSILARYR